MTVEEQKNYPTFKRPVGIFGFIEGIPHPSHPYHMSKSKMGVYEKCPRYYWHEEVAGDEARWGTGDFVQKGITGSALHSVEEAFLREVSLDLKFREYIQEDYMNVIMEHFTNHGEDQSLKNLAQFHIWRYYYYMTLFKDPNKIFHYFSPIIIENEDSPYYGKPMIELKIYSEELDWSCVVDSVYWIPGKRKDDILIHDLKNRYNVGSRLTGYRKELNFMRHIINDLEIFPNHTCIAGAITFTRETELKKEAFYVKFTKRQEDSLARFVKKFNFSVANDVWPCNVQNHCEWCPFAYLCSMDNKFEEFFQSDDD